MFKWIKRVFGKYFVDDPAARRIYVDAIASVKDYRKTPTGVLNLRDETVEYYDMSGMFTKDLEGILRIVLHRDSFERIVLLGIQKIGPKKSDWVEQLAVIKVNSEAGSCTFLYSSLGAEEYRHLFLKFYRLSTKC